MLIDASCTPADITYPTDLKLLGEASEKSEHDLDLLHEPFVGQHPKPRTDRQKARRQFLTVAKRKKPGAQKIRKAIGQQLRYLKRNLGHIARYLNFEPRALCRLSSYQMKCLQVIHTLYEQQLKMYKKPSSRFMCALSSQASESLIIVKRVRLSRMRYRIATVFFFLRLTASLGAVGALFWMFWERSYDAGMAFGWCVAGAFVLSFAYLVARAPLVCPVCKARSFGSEVCSRHRHARCWLGSYNLPMAVDVLLTRARLRCQLCNATYRFKAYDSKKEVLKRSEHDQFPHAHYGKVKGG